MLHRPRVLVSLVVLLAFLMAEAGVSQPDQEAALQAHFAAQGAQLAIQILEQGNCQITLAVFFKKTAPKKEDIEQKLREAFDFPLQDVKATQTKYYLSLQARATHAFPREGARIEGELNVASLAKVLHAADIATLQVTIIRVGRANRDMTPVHQKVATANPQSVPFVFEPGYSLLWTGLMLAVVFVVPIGIVLDGLRRAMRSTEADKAVVWYRLWRRTHWLVLGTWLAWLTAAMWLRPEEFVLAMLGIETAAGWPTALTWATRLMPPWLVTAVCNGLTQVAYARLRQVDRSAGDILRETAWDIAGTFVPLFMAALGVFLLIDKEFRLGAIWLAAAWGSRMVLARLAARSGPDLTPYAITEGPLRERVFQLAKEAGVTLQQVYVLPTGKVPHANAAAMLGGNILLTDHLLQNLTVRETDAIIAHELTHLKFGHPTWLLVIVIAAVLVPSLLLPSWDRLWDGAAPIGIQLPIGIGLGGLAFFFVSRRFEYQTDSYAAWLTGDPEALITGLVKLHRISLMPLQWGKWDEHLLTHPSTSRRLEAIARENGLSKRRLNEILDAATNPAMPANEASAGAAPDHYDYLRADAEADKVFSTALRNKAIVRQSWINLGVIVLVPALTASIAHWAPLEATARWLVLIGGVVTTAALFVTLQNYLPVRAYPEMQRRLQERLQADGLIPPGAPAFFVGLSPDATSRVYQGFLNWDIGFLFLTGDRLLYVGEKTRFAVRREQITAVRLEWDVRHWWRVPTLYVAWQDGERGTSGTFNVRRGDQLRSMRQMAQQTCELHNVLGQWRERPATPSELATALTELTSPAIGDVTSMDPAVQLRLALVLVLYQLGFVSVVAVGASWLFGFPFDWEDGTGWYVPVVAASMVLLAIAPILWQRMPQPVDMNARASIDSGT